MKPFQLILSLRKTAAHLFGILFGLIQVTTPLLTIVSLLVDFELMCDTFNFDHPLFFGDTRVDDSVSSHIGLHLLSHILLNSSYTSKIDVLINVFIIFSFSMDFVGQVSATVHFVSIDFISLIVKSCAFFTHLGLFEAEALFESHFAKFEEHSADFFAVSCL